MQSIKLGEKILYPESNNVKKLRDQGYNKLLSLFIDSRLNTSNKEKIEDFTLPIIDLLEETEDIDTGLVYYKYGLDKEELKKAFKLINKAIESNKRILIITDYDCDGINSAVVSKILTDKYFPNKDKIDVIVNKRMFGNGVNKEIIKNIKMEDYALIITADHGSSNQSLWLSLKDEYQDLSIIVTDHHIIPSDNYPVSIDVLLNNMSSASLNQNLSGCYTVFFLLLYYIVKSKLDKTFNVLYEVVEYIALTIVSDVMSAKEPVNRFIFALAMDKINRKDSKFFNNVRTIINLPKLITLDDFRFTICPVINTGNRLHHEHVAYEALLGNVDMLEKLFKLNDKRKMVTNLALEKLKEDDNIFVGSFVSGVIKTTLGINGIIASKLGEIYRKPSIAFTREPNSNILHGSCRSIIPGINIRDILEELFNRGLVETYGGHEQAAGCTINIKDYDEFISQANTLFAIATSRLPKEELIDIDGVVNLDDFNLLTVDTLSRFRLFGKDFEDPTFYTEFYVHSAFVNNTIARITAYGDLGIYNLIAFNNIKSDLRSTFREGNKVGCIIKPSITYFRKRYELRLLITRAIVL